MIATYSYDALGRRIVASYPNATGAPVKNLYYSADGQVLEERWNSTASSAVQYQYVWSLAGGANTLVLRDQSGTLSQRLYVEQDPNDNVSSITDISGNVVERFLYDPYGTYTFMNPAGTGTSTNAVGWEYLFQGGRVDFATGREQFGLRDYILFEGKWAERDPLGQAAGDNNIYAFVGDNPVAYVDPTGLFGDGPEDALLPKSGQPFAARINHGVAYSPQAIETAHDLQNPEKWKDFGQATIEVASNLDPTPASDVVNAAISSTRGDTDKTKQYLGGAVATVVGGWLLAKGFNLASSAGDDIERAVDDVVDTLRHRPNSRPAVPNPVAPNSDEIIQKSKGIVQTEHAKLRSTQGRPISEVVNDIQRAGPKDVFVQPDGRFVVRFKKQREHVITSDGNHLSSFDRPKSAHIKRIQDGKIRPATAEELQLLKNLVN